MRVESGRRAVLRLAVEGRPAHTYSTPGRTIRSSASGTAGTTIQGRGRNCQAVRAIPRPQFEQKRLSGFTEAPHAGQNDPFGFGDVIFTLTGNIILRGSRSPPPTLPSPTGGGEPVPYRQGWEFELGLQHTGAEHRPQVGQRPVLDLVAGMPWPVEGLDRRGRYHYPVIAVSQVRHRVENADIGADADHRH